MATSPRPFQDIFRKNARTTNAFKQPQDMVRHDTLEGERKEHYKKWITFFRRNPVRFIETYFNIPLYPYQILWIWIMQKSNLGYIVASRGAAKTFIIAIWALTLCVLYPGIQVITASKTLKQGGLILGKIKDLMNKYPNVAREIESITMNSNGYECTFHCGSTIKAVPSSENARGNRCNYLIIEESRLVSKEVLEQVLKPFLFSRAAPYRLKAPYKNDPLLKEEGIITYITSAGYKAEYWYSYVKACIKRMISGDTTANFLAFDYLITSYHNIKTDEMLKNEMADNDALTVQMEYLNIPSGISGKSYYKLSYFPRVIKKAFYPQRLETFNQKKNPYDIPRMEDEIRFLSVDVATRSGKANDLTIISCVSAIPLLGVGYERRLMYLESFKGINTVMQAKRIKELFFDFGADYMVIDLQNAGISVFDSLTQSTISDERGVTYAPFTVVGEEFMFIEDKLRQELTERTLSIDAKPVVFPILASQQSNSQMAALLRGSLQKKLWRFLQTEVEAEDWLIRNNKEFTSTKKKDGGGEFVDSDDYAFFMHPYVQTALMIGECINLDMSLVNGMVKLQEKPGAYKDRYTSILYLNYIISQFDKDLLKETAQQSDWEWIQSMTQIY